MDHLDNIGSDEMPVFTYGHTAPRWKYFISTISARLRFSLYGTLVSHCGQDTTPSKQPLMYKSPAPFREIPVLLHGDAPHATFVAQLLEFYLHCPLILLLPLVCVENWQYVQVQHHVDLFRKPASKYNDHCSCLPKNVFLVISPSPVWWRSIHKPTLYMSLIVSLLKLEAPSPLLTGCCGA